MATTTSRCRKVRSVECRGTAVTGLVQVSATVHGDGPIRLARRCSAGRGALVGGSRTWSRMVTRRRVGRRAPPWTRGGSAAPSGVEARHRMVVPLPKVPIAARGLIADMMPAARPPPLPRGMGAGPPVRMQTLTRSGRLFHKGVDAESLFWRSARKSRGENRAPCGGDPAILRQPICPGHGPVGRWSLHARAGGHHLKRRDMSDSVSILFGWGNCASRPSFLCESGWGWGWGWATGHEDGRAVRAAVPLWAGRAPTAVTARWPGADRRHERRGRVPVDARAVSAEADHRARR